MSQRMDLQRFFRWLNLDKTRASRSRGQKLFAPLTDELEARRLMTLNVWIDDSNVLQIEADDDLSQFIDLSYDGNTQTYTITSLNSQSNFFIVSDTSSGLTVSTTNYTNPANPAKLTIVEAAQSVSSILMTTGDATDQINVNFSPAPVSVFTGGSSDLVAHAPGFNSTRLFFDGGTGDDLIFTNYQFTGAFNITQNVFGSDPDSVLGIDTSIGVNAPSKFINVRSRNVENASNTVQSPDSNLTVNINGITGNPNGGFLDNTALVHMSLTPLVNTRSVNVFGYDSNDDIQAYVSSDGTNTFVGIQGPRLPVIDVYNMNPVQGILRLRTLDGDDIVKVNPGVENLTRILVDGGTGHDFISADATLLGGSGNDTLIGGAGDDSIDGGLGDDFIGVTGGTDTYVGGGGFDTVFMHGVPSSNHNLSITQDQGVPAVIDQDGVISNVTMTDIARISVLGSSGNDELLIDGTSTTPVPILAFMGAGEDSIASTSASSQHVVTGYGEAGQDTYDAGPGLDTFYGGDDADTYVSSDNEENADIFDGGAGENFLNGFGTSVWVLDVSGILTMINGIGGLVSGYSVSQVNIRVIDPGNNAVRLQADAGDNTILVTDSTTNPTLLPGQVQVAGLMVPVFITGFAAGDTLEIAGNAGADTFTARGSGAASLTFEGGIGLDTFFVVPTSTAATFQGSAGDIVNVSGSNGADTVLLDPGVGEMLVHLGSVIQTVQGATRYFINTWGGPDSITLRALENEDITADAGGDDDFINAIDVKSAIASVHLYGGEGSDEIQAPISANTIIVAGGLGNDLIELIAPGSAFGEGGDDQIFGGPGDDSLDGGEGNDVISGGTGADSISTGPGLNIVNAGPGDDIVAGGSGSDSFSWFAGDGFDTYTGGGGEDLISATGADADANIFQVLRFGTGYLVDYNGTEGFLGLNVNSVEMYAGVGSTASGFVEDMSGISVDRIGFFFDLATTSDVAASATLGNDDLVVASVPGFPGVVSIAGLSYQFRYLGEATGTATNLAVFGLDGDDTIKSTIISPTITTILFDGGVGDDFLSADATLIGGPGNDTLQGGLGNDSLIGNEGDDQFLISEGTDTVEGGSGFDILKLVGSTGAPNFFAIDQTTGLPVSIQVNLVITDVDLTDVDQISVQGSTGQDFVFVTGDSLTPVPVFATLGLGNDIVDTNAASIGQRTDAYGEGGEDYYLSGPGTDYFYGGDDYDLFDAMYASRDSFDFFDGGSGFNDLYVEGSAFGNNVITAIPSGFRVTNTNGTGVTTALNIGSVFVDSAGSGVILNATNDDNVIRTYDNTSNLVPQLADNELLVTGMPGTIRVTGIETGSFVDIHGQGGNDTFQSLGNSDVPVTFFGESGNDRLVVTQESKLANFQGGDGFDTVDVTTTLGDDTVVVSLDLLGERINVNGVDQALIYQADLLSIDMLDGDDLLEMTGLSIPSELTSFEYSGGAGDDRILLGNFTASAGVVFRTWGGAGNDEIIAGGDGDGLLIASGGSGDDNIISTLRSQMFGDEGNDQFIGSDFIDSISGGAGNDSIDGGQGDDELFGDAGQDEFIWFVGDGNDLVDGGTGQDKITAQGAFAAPNTFSLAPQSPNSILFDMIIAGTVIRGGEIEHVTMIGGEDSDVISIADLSLTSITLVDVDFGIDAVPDLLNVQGSTANDFVVISGTDDVQISGLPYFVRLTDANFSATTLVDGILFDGHLGEDTIITASNLTNPVLVTINGGAGGDDIRINSPTLGDNTDRVTIDVSGDVFADVIQLRNGRNRVIGGDLDVILVSGTENADRIDVTPDGGGRVEISLTPPGFFSSNDLTGFTGVVHIEGLGSDDEINSLADLRSTVWGGDGNDRIFVGQAGSLVYGGSGNDLVSGGLGDDTFYGGAGDDDLSGDEGNDLLFGEDGADFLSGGLGLDQLFGGADSDLLLPGKNGTLGPEFVDGGSGLDQIRFDLNGVSGIIGRTAGFVNVGDFGDVSPATAFNSIDAEDLLAIIDSTVPGSTGYELTIQDLTGSQVNFVRPQFVDAADANTLSLAGTIARDVIDADYVLPPGGEPNAQVLMPWGTVWAYKPASALANDTLQIMGGAGDDDIKVSDALSLGGFGWNIVLDGGAGNDFLSADATLIGGDGNDTLLGGTGDDSLEGGLGDDVFLLSDGTDTFVGGGGFDTVHVSGITDAINFFRIEQNAGFPASITVNADTHDVELSDIELISVQGSSARDNLFVQGDSPNPVAVLAILGAGDDSIDTEQASLDQRVTAWGEAGFDIYVSGPGFDTFYGGDDFDAFEMSVNSFDSFDWFDGGTGFNELFVVMPGVGITTIENIPSGYRVTNSAFTGQTTALNVGVVNVQANGGGLVLNGSNNDDTIRTFDSTSDLVPQLPLGMLLVAGLGAADFKIFGVVPGMAIDIHGQGGNDTFQSLGNAESVLSFYGESGDDLFEITDESRFATFYGNVGYNRTAMRGTAYNDIIDVDLSNAVTASLSLNGIVLGDAWGNDEISIDALGGQDEIRVDIDQFMFFMRTAFLIDGGSDSDIIDLNAGGGSYGNYTVDGGAGDDYIIGSTEAGTQLLYGGLGNDRIETNAAALVFGNEGNDTLIGSTANDSMSGGDGEDDIFGFVGNDQLYGDAGDDLIEGGEGFDAMYGGADSDLILPGTNDGLAPEIVDGGSGLDQVRFAFSGNAALIGRTASTVNVGEFGGTTAPTSFNSTDVEDLLVDANTTVLGATGMELTIQDLTGSQVDFVRVIFPDANDNNRLIVQGSIANDTIDASFVLPPGGEPNAQVLMPWGTVWAFTQASPAPLNTLHIEGREGDDTIKASAFLNEGAFAWNIVLQGDEGDDYLSADATIIGGAGNDTLQGGLGNDSLEGGDGDDVFLLSAGLDTFLGGAGFDIVSVYGSVGADNLFELVQDAATPANFFINGISHDAELLEIDQISVQGSTGRDTLNVYGDSVDQVPVFAMMGAGDDLVRTNALDNAAEMEVTAYGEAGVDAYFAGAGSDDFYGGDDFDTFVSFSESATSMDTFDGGSGRNWVQYQTFDGGITSVGTTPGGFVFQNSITAGQLIALNVSEITTFMTPNALGVSVVASNDDNTIRTFDGDSDIVPPLLSNQLVITGLPAEFEILDVVAGSLIDIFGNGGNDSFQALGNAGAIVTFFGDSGDDKFIVTSESETARFTGGAGLDTVIVTGTEENDALVFDNDGTGALQVTVGLTNRGVVVEADSLIANGLAGGDRIEVRDETPSTGLRKFELNGGIGGDLIFLNGTKMADYVVNAGDGNDVVIGPDGFARVLIYAGGGNDEIGGGTAAIEAYGEAGNDTIFGSTGNDRIYGGDGDDSMFGGVGNDQIQGGADQDFIAWNYGDGDDTSDGGTGQDTLYFDGNQQGLSNIYDLRAKSQLANLYQVTINGARVEGGEIEHVIMDGGNATDTFTIGDLSQTSINLVDANYGIDTVTDAVLMVGTTNNDTILLTGTDGRAIASGLPWLVRASNILANGNTLVDGISIDGTLGDDWLRSGFVSTSPMLVTVIGGQGNDLIEVNTIPLGDNTNRVTVYSDGDIFSDRILLTNGRNLVFGGPNDVIEVSGTENTDQISIDGAAIPGRVVFDVNGVTSSNNLTNFQGVIHVDGLGANDTISARSYSIPTSIMGGLGNDVLDASSMSGSVSLYGGSGDDSLTGGSADDYLAGGEGYDFLTGAGGFDLIEGGSEGDYVYWRAGDGIDYVDGGTGENTFVATGSPTDANSFLLQSDDDPATSGRMSLFVGGLLNGFVDFASMQLVRLIGGTGTDSFDIGDLSDTAVKIVETDFGVDSVADSLIISGTDNADDVTLNGGNKITASGLPWKITAVNAAFNGTALVDSVTVDLGLGNDKLLTARGLNAPVLLNLFAGQGLDEIHAEADFLGSNSHRTKIDTRRGVDATRLWLDSGSNFVYGKLGDVIVVEGSENMDLFGAIYGTGVNTYIDVNNSLSLNELTQFTGVIQVNLLGGEDYLTLSGYSTPTSVFGGAGNDHIDASGMNIPVYLFGGDGNDELQGGSSQDFIDGGAGNDILQGNQGFDTILGGDGSDVIGWATGDDMDDVDGGTGDDRLIFSANGPDDQKVTLTPATSSTPSTATGIGMGNANMILAAMEGNGSVRGGSIESVLLEGGDGCDLFGIGNLQTTDVRVVDVVINNPDGHAVVSTYATNLPDVITVTADAPNQIGVNGLAVPVRVFGAVADATAIVVHAGFGGDTIEVDPQAEAQAIIVIDGGSGNDNITGGSIIIGGPGNNTLVGSDLPNTIVGGTGSDTIYGLGAGDTLFGDAEVLNIDILGPNCEYIGNLIILPTATGAPDLIYGGDGDDFINGNVGGDSIFGGEGNDDIGALTYNGIFFPEAGNDQIDAGEGDNCVFSGEGDDTVVAGNGNNRIVLDTGNDKATTGDGNNSIFGGAGDDSVTTGSGADVVSLGAGNDTANLGSGNDIAWGGDGNDFMIGGYGNDSLYGGAGNDILWGGIKATQPLKKGQKHAPIEPSDGDDVLAGNDGFDQLDGGNSNNIMDAGADYIRETMIGSGGWDTAFIHKDEGKFQDVLKNHSKRYTLIPYGAMLIPVTPNTPTDCDSPILVTVPNPLAGALNKPPKKTAVPKSNVVNKLRGR